jgi:hypothetical protein
VPLEERAQRAIVPTRDGSDEVVVVHLNMLVARKRMVVHAEPDQIVRSLKECGS